jgi:CheY-like chemotaxis protein
MKTIAVVEDNADNRLLVSAILGELYRVVEYTNGPEALGGMRREPPDLVLLDVSLPGMDGTELLRHIRADAALRGLPVVVLTAHAMAGDRERYLDLGFDDYLPKPIVDENDLLGAVARLLRGR